MHARRNRNILLGIALVALVGTFIFYFYALYGDAGLASDARTIRLTENGFSPAELKIKKGDVVIFSNETDREFWPASNQHPSHGEYPEFDPGDALPAGGTWSFVFDRVGVWNFHDHLNARMRGTVTVVGDDGGTTEECLKRGDNEREGIQAKCWEGEIVAAIEEGGLAAAFTRFNELLNSDPLFAANCHDVMHIVGDAAYRVYVNEGSVPHDRATSACGYGFYHGFIERMLRERGDYAESREYCASIESRSDFGSRTMAYNAAAGCRHGIGHAIIDSLPGSSWGDGPLMAGLGVHQCEQIFEGDRERVSCASGIANALAIAYNNSHYNLGFERGGHWNACSAMADLYQPSCYQEMAVHYLNYTERSYEDAMLLLKQDIPPASQTTVLRGYMSHQAQREDPTTESLTLYAHRCSSFADTALQNACFLGALDGLAKSAAPQHIAERASALCRAVQSNDAQTRCATQMISSLRVALERDTLASACAELQREFEVTCN